MTRAPVAPVAALRETAILFGVVMARFLLGERPKSLLVATAAIRPPGLGATRAGSMVRVAT